MQTCPSCQAENPGGARFCNQCGFRLVAAEPSSQRTYTPRHLAERILKTRAALQGERKRVTVLFADIKGSTRLAQEAGAEAWHSILDRFFAILAGAVHRYEGTVNQYTGDGIMALFGAPIAHEDHAQRACFAALQMQAEVRRFADELRLGQGLNLSMRVGLNTGEVIVGRIGDDLRMDYTAQGPTVNLAARMEHICEPGRIYLARQTAALVEGYFSLRSLGRLSVAGLDEPVEVCELEGVGALKTRLDRSLARGGGPFIGRETELAALTAALERARGGQGQVVAVVGNAGIGKSRLCHEFAQASERAGVAVHRATGVPYASALPLLPVQSLLKSRLGLPERAAAAEVRRLVAGTFLLHDPAHAAVLPAVFDFLDVAEGATLAPEQASRQRQRMFELFAAYLPCGDAPQILLVEDLHFLDAASEEFMALLCRRVRDSHTLLLLNFRPDYISEWLIPHLDEQVAVSALGAGQLEQLAHSLLGSDASLEGVAARIRERAGGNPFFVEEAVQALAESEHLQGGRGAYRLVRAIDEWPVPDTVHALLAARIDRLDDGHKAVLQTASVIGQQFQAEWLSELLQQAAAPCEEQLGVLEDAGFVHLRESGHVREYAFCHPLMQEVAYQSQLESRRAQAHARLAAALEQRHAAAGPLTAAAVNIAHHWARAGEWERAGAWNLNAARWAGTRDMAATVEQYRLAERHLDRAPFSVGVRKLRIAARAGKIRMAQFAPVSREEVERAYAEARRMADECGDIACAAELLLSYGNEHLHRGDAAEAARLCGDAVNLCLDNGLGELVARFRLSVLMTHTAAGWSREGLDLVDRATGSGWRSEPVGEDNFMSRAYYGVMLAWTGHLPEAEANLRAALAFAEREDRAASWMHATFADLAWFSGDDAEALPAARRAYQRAEAFGSPFFLAVALRALGLAHSLRGDHAEAVRFLEQSLPLVAPGAFAHQFEAHHLALLAEALAGCGRADEAVRTAEAAIASAQRSGSRIWELRAWLALLLLLPAGGAADARMGEGLSRAGALLESSGAEAFRPWLALAQARRGGADAAAWRARARDGFARIGAHGHVARLDAESG